MKRLALRPLPEQYRDFLEKLEADLSVISEFNTIFEELDAQFPLGEDENNIRSIPDDALEARFAREPIDLNTVAEALARAIQTGIEVTDLGWVTTGYTAYLLTRSGLFKRLGFRSLNAFVQDNPKLNKSYQLLTKQRALYRTWLVEMGKAKPVIVEQIKDVGNIDILTALTPIVTPDNVEVWVQYAQQETDKGRARIKANTALTISASQRMPLSLITPQVVDDYLEDQRQAIISGKTVVRFITKATRLPQEWRKLADDDQYIEATMEVLDEHRYILHCQVLNQKPKE